MIFKQTFTLVSWSARVAWVLLVLLACVGKSQDFSQVPGVVIDDSPKSTQSYIGSPSITILPNGDYLVSHDYFGPGSTETTSGVEKVFISHDKGTTWSLQSTINGPFWSSLFVYNNDLYIFGMQSDAGIMVIRKSTDNGVTWTTPSTLSTGLIRTGAYGSAPNQMQVVDGRIWLAASYSASPVAVSAPVG
ncbi:MAG TPA: sialidase family protein, partial [Pirellulales bacterium]